LARLPVEGDPLEVHRFVEDVGHGMSARVDGHFVQVGRSSFVGVDEAAVEPRQVRSGQEVWVAIDNIVRGRYFLSDSYREGLEQAIGRLGSDYRLMVTSGDNDRERSRLEAIFGGRGSFDFEQTPFDKRDQVGQLMSEGRRVLMIGDGLNDSGALKAAEVGVALAENGVGFTPASDGIMDASRLVRLPRYLRFAKGVVHVVWMAYALSFIYNVVGLYVAARLGYPDADQFGDGGLVRPAGHAVAGETFASLRCK
jgi:Cu+-exporting ATPase